MNNTRSSSPQNRRGNASTSNFYFAGSRTELVDALGNRHVTYQTDRGRVIKDAFVLSASFGDVFNDTSQSSAVNVTTNQYDGLDRLMLTTLTDANNHTTAFAPDGFDRLSTTTYPLGSTQAFTYDGNGNVLTRKTRAGATIAFTYDTLNRVASKAAPGEATVTYSYDLAGRPLGVSDTSASIVAPAASASYSTNLTYDALSRPTSVNWTPAPSQTTPPAATTVSFGHSYDATNRRVGQTATDNSWLYYPGAASTVSYTANELNQYTAVGSVSPTYDGNGNLAFDGTFTHGYDAENRLTAGSQGGTPVASYTYDAQGRRKSKTVGGTTTIFVTDADNREVLEYDGNSGVVARWYAYGLGPNEVLGQQNLTSGTRTTLIPDIQGSFMAALDSTSGTLTKAGYLPYGESTSISGTFRYTGQRIDPETNGLYYYRARMYMPAWGRFLQPDPIGYNGSANLHAYVGNDPLNLIDPFGLTWAEVFRMFGQWVTGTAPAHQVFGSDTNQTKDMMNAPGVNRAREFFYQQNISNSGDQLQPVNKFAVHFGLSGYVEAGTNSTQQFVGSYTVNITPNSNGTLTFQINNTTSMTSFFYGLWPNSLNPSAGHPMGNYSQTYTWTEQYKASSGSSSGNDDSVSAPTGSVINPAPDASNLKSIECRRA